MDKKEIQQVAESSILNLLTKRGHLVIGKNIRRSHYEFDLVSRFGNVTRIHEVRGTESQRPVALQFFSKVKILTLIKGVGIYFAGCEIHLHLVSVRAGKPVHAWHYRIEDFL